MMCRRFDKEVSYFIASINAKSDQVKNLIKILTCYAQAFLLLRQPLPLTSPRFPLLCPPNACGRRNWEQHIGYGYSRGSGSSSSKSKCMYNIAGPLYIYIALAAGNEELQVQVVVLLPIMGGLPGRPPEPLYIYIQGNKHTHKQRTNNKTHLHTHKHTYTYLCCMFLHACVCCFCFSLLVGMLFIYTENSAFFCIYIGASMTLFPPNSAHRQAWSSRTGLTLGKVPSSPSAAHLRSCRGGVGHP
jgi:hypothetical protein